MSRVVRSRLATVGAVCLWLWAGVGAAPRVLAQSTPSRTSAPTQDVAVLDLDTTTERTLDRRQEHLYQLTLWKDECISLVVEQRGVDVVVQVRRPDGGVIADFQQEFRRDGRENVDIVAEQSGTYILVVKSGPGLPSGSYAIWMTGRRPATAADRSLQEARGLQTLGIGLRSAAKYDEAQSRLERAMAIAESLHGPDDVLVGTMAFELGINALEQRADRKAEPLFQRALDVFDKTWGAEHPYSAITRSRMALLLRNAGQGPKAEALLRQAMEVIERTLGTDHPWYVVCLTTEAILRDAAGDLDAAEKIDLRALAILEKIEDTDSNRYAALLVNVGWIYAEKRDYARAQGFYLRSLALAERLEGTESYHVSINLQNLAVVAREQKDYSGALEYNLRALSIRERLLGTDHPDVAEILSNLAIVQRLTGDHASVLQTQLRVLGIWEKTRGPYHRGTLVAVGNIARTYAGAGDVAHAVEFQRRADSIIETALALNLVVGSERQKLALVNSIAERTDRTISLALNEARDVPDAGALAALVLLQRKGRVLDAMMDARRVAHKRAISADDQGLLDRLNATMTQLARVALNPSDQEPADDRRRRLAELEAQKERLEADLSQHNAELRAELGPVTLASVQEAIPDDAALVELAVYRPFDPKQDHNAEAYGSPHYSAFVLRKHTRPWSVDLGPASVIDDAIDGFRAALRDPSRTDMKQRARAIDERVMRPLRDAFGDATRLLISPDGALSLVPFEAFVDEQGRYLVERYAMSYLTSGRDLLRMHVTPDNRSTSVVIVADPFFGERAMTSVDRPLPPTATATASAGAQNRGGAAADDLSSMYFAPLAGTAAEAEAILTLFPEATLLSGRKATKHAIEQLSAPRILHIASHGFFLQGAVDNPLLRSGVALAGANLDQDSHNNGILTALEASGLNLWGTELVTLSACDTGIGEVRNGEGVYGLRRAFVLAGAETLVMSLWPVSDYITREAMKSYYTGLRAGIGRGDALRLAKLTMLKQKGREHPFYWASFIQSGEWTGLDGQH